MRKSDSLMKVTIGRFGSEPKEVELEKDATVRQALEELGLDVGETTNVYVNGVKASMRDILEEGDLVNLVTPKQAGSVVTSSV